LSLEDKENTNNWDFQVFLEKRGMLIQFCSDLHLEFKENEAYIVDNPLPVVGDILILAGDIIPFSKQHRHNYFIDYVSANFKATYWLPGNHEFYDWDAVTGSGHIHEEIRHNVFLVNNDTVILDGVTLIFSTLWSHINPMAEIIVRERVNDFKLIKHFEEKLSVKDYNFFHGRSLVFIEKEIEKRYAGPIVMVTHHVPTFKNYPKKYKADILNSIFATELYDIVEDSRFDYWIYGHHHNNIPSFMIGKTHLVTNQLGYVRHNEHRDFVPGRVIKIEI
jgi:predicted phosphohydrolase